MFSSRLPAALAPNAISRTTARLQAERVSLLDLTETNPTAVSLMYPADVLAPLADSRARHYDPAPLGLPSAREAVAREYQLRGVVVDPASIVLTASTSEAYGLLFKLLCNPGDEVLVPQPSYPLFESLTALEAVVARPYRLEYHGAWSLDRDSVERAITPRTRAVLVVSPNNPTGSLLRADDRDWLAACCARANLALIADEVFSEYVLSPVSDAVSFAGEDRVLTFVLGGLSKSAGLPQVKLGWMLVSGPRDAVPEALTRLEIICDTYLSVSTPVQLAAPQLIAAGRGIRARIQERISANLACVTGLCDAESAASVLMPDGGWSVVLRVPATEPEEALVLRLLRDAHVLVHPGYFFDFDEEAYLVASLLPEPDRFREAMTRVLAAVASERPV
jgi:alanine-synthesizing transaminase